MITLRHIPLVRFLVPFILGIIFAIYQDAGSSVFFILFIICSIIYVTGIYLRKYRINYDRYYFLHECLLFICFFIGGIVIVIQQSDHNYEDYYRNHYQKGAISIVEIIQPVHIKSRSVECEVEIKKLVVNKSQIFTSGKALLYLKIDSNSLALLPGDVLKVKADWIDVKPPSNPGQFNYRNFLKFRQIEQQYYSYKNWELLHSDPNSMYRFASESRNYLLSLFSRSGLIDQEFAVASALILGYKDEIDNQTKHAYSSAGATHVLAVSGLHVGIVYLIINSFLSVLFRYRKLFWFKILLILFILWAYAILTGLSPSVFRATTMFTFIVVGKVLGRRSSIYNTLAASGFFLLFIDPYLIMQVGFQLSYLAVIGIVYFQPRIYNKITFKYCINDKIWAITSVSIAAQITTFPLGLLYFHQFPNYFLISNLLVIPAAYVILIIGFLVLLTSFIPIISVLFGWLLKSIIIILNTGVHVIDQLPYSLIEGISISVFETYLIYLIIILISIGLAYKRLRIINLGLFVLGILFFIDLNEDFSLHDKKQITIYDSADHIAMDFISGVDHIFIADQELYEDEAAMLFNIKHHWYDMDLRYPKFICVDHLKQNIIRFSNMSIVILNDNDDVAINEGDYIVFSGKFKGSYRDIINKYHQHQFIMLSDLNNKQKTAFKHIAESNNVNYYDISEKGAWSMLL